MKRCPIRAHWACPSWRIWVQKKSGTYYWSSSANIRVFIWLMSLIFDQTDMAGEKGSPPKKSLRYCCGHHGRKADGRLGAKDIVIDDNAEQRMWGSKGTVSGSVGGEIGELSLHDDMSYERTESDGLQWLASSQTLVHGLDGRNGHGNNYFISILHKI